MNGPELIMKKRETIMIDPDIIMEDLELIMENGVTVMKACDAHKMDSVGEKIDLEVVMKGSDDQMIGTVIGVVDSSVY